MRESPGREDRFRRIVGPDEYAALWRCACRLATSREDAEDLLQETLARAYQCLHQLRDDARAKAWACSIMRRVYLGKLAQGRRSTPADPAADPVDLPGDAGPATVANGLARAVRQAVAGLPAAQRTAVELFHFDGFSLTETAAALGVSENNVKQRLWRARQSLLERLSPSLQAGELTELF